MADLAILVYLTANQVFGKFDIKQRNLVLPTTRLRAQSPKLKTGKRFHILLQFGLAMKAAMQQPADKISLAYYTSQLPDNKTNPARLHPVSLLHETSSSHDCETTPR